MDGYADDATIEGHEVIWRRIPPDQVHWDTNLGRWRPQTGMFADSSDGSPMSACRANLYPSTDSVLAERGHPHHFLAAVPVGLLRDLGLQVASLPEIPDDPGHVWIVGKKTDRIRKKLAKTAEWVVPPPADPPV